MKAELFSKDVQEFLRLLAKHAVRYATDSSLEDLLDTERVGDVMPGS